MSNTRKYVELTYLKGRITEQKKTYRSVSENTGIPLNSLSNKLNGYSLFDILEMDALCQELNIIPSEIPKFFLTGHCETQHPDNDPCAS